MVPRWQDLFAYWESIALSETYIIKVSKNYCRRVLAIFI